jgi:hypothetical protein
LNDGCALNVLHGLVAAGTALLFFGWEPDDNNEHKIINCPVPVCPMSNKGEAGKTTGTLSYLKILR